MTEGVSAIHATALIVGEAGILIRGSSGAGKSRLALLLLDEARRQGRFVRLVGDDRIRLRPCHGRVVAMPHPVIAGLIEHRTQGLLHLPHASRCVVRLIVDLQPPDDALPRFPVDGPPTDELVGVGGLPRLRLQGPPDILACRSVLDALSTLFGAVRQP